MVGKGKGVFSRRIGVFLLGVLMAHSLPAKLGDTISEITPAQIARYSAPQLGNLINQTTAQYKLTDELPDNEIAIWVKNIGNAIQALQRKDPTGANTARRKTLTILNATTLDVQEKIKSNLDLIAIIKNNMIDPLYASVEKNIKGNRERLKLTNPSLYDTATIIEKAKKTFIKGRAAVIEEPIVPGGTGKEEEEEEKIDVTREEVKVPAKEEPLLSVDESKKIAQQVIEEQNTHISRSTKLLTSLKTQATNSKTLAALQEVREALDKENKKRIVPLLLLDLNSFETIIRDKLTDKLSLAFSSLDRKDVSIKAYLIMDKLPEATLPDLFSPLRKEINALNSQYEDVMKTTNAKIEQKVKEEAEQEEEEEEVVKTGPTEPLRQQISDVINEVINTINAKIQEIDQKIDNMNKMGSLDVLEKFEKDIKREIIDLRQEIIPASFNTLVINAMKKLTKNENLSPSFINDNQERIQGAINLLSDYITRLDKKIDEKKALLEFKTSTATDLKDLETLKGLTDTIKTKALQKAETVVTLTKSGDSPARIIENIKQLQSYLQADEKLANSYETDRVAILNRYQQKKNMIATQYTVDLESSPLNKTFEEAARSLEAEIKGLQQEVKKIIENVNLEHEKIEKVQQEQPEEEKEEETPSTDLTAEINKAIEKVSNDQEKILTTVEILITEGTDVLNESSLAPATLGAFLQRSRPQIYEQIRTVEDNLKEEKFKELVVNEIDNNNGIETKSAKDAIAIALRQLDAKVWALKKDKLESLEKLTTEKVANLLLEPIQKPFLEKMKALQSLNGGVEGLNTAIKGLKADVEKIKSATAEGPAKKIEALQRFKGQNAASLDVANQLKKNEEDIHTEYQKKRHALENKYTPQLLLRETKVNKEFTDAGDVIYLPMKEGKIILEITNIGTEIDALIAKFTEEEKQQTAATIENDRNKIMNAFTGIYKSEVLTTINPLIEEIDEAGKAIDEARGAKLLDELQATLEQLSTKATNSIAQIDDQAIKWVRKEATDLKINDATVDALLQEQTVRNRIKTDIVDKIKDRYTNISARIETYKKDAEKKKASLPPEDKTGEATIPTPGEGTDLTDAQKEAITKFVSNDAFTNPGDSTLGKILSYFNTVLPENKTKFAFDVANTLVSLNNAAYNLLYNKNLATKVDDAAETNAMLKAAADTSNWAAATGIQQKYDAAKADWGADTLNTAFIDNVILKKFTANDAGGNFAEISTFMQQIKDLPTDKIEDLKRIYKVLFTTVANGMIDNLSKLREQAKKEIGEQKTSSGFFGLGGTTIQSIRDNEKAKFADLLTTIDRYKTGLENMRKNVHNAGNGLFIDLRFNIEDINNKVKKLQQDVGYIGSTTISSNITADRQKAFVLIKDIIPQLGRGQDQKTNIADLESIALLIDKATSVMEDKEHFKNVVELFDKINTVVETLNEPAIPSTQAWGNIKLDLDDNLNKLWINIAKSALVQGKEITGGLDVPDIQETYVKSIGANLNNLYTNSRKPKEPFVQPEQ